MSINIFRINNIIIKIYINTNSQLLNLIDLK